MSQHDDHLAQLVTHTPEIHWPYAEGCLAARGAHRCTRPRVVGWLCEEHDALARRLEAAGQRPIKATAQVSPRCRLLAELARIEAQRARLLNLPCGRRTPLDRARLVQLNERRAAITAQLDRASAPAA